MALFGSKKNTKAKKADSKPTSAKATAGKEVAVAEPKEAGVSLRDLSGVIKRPRITEKASMKAEANVYAFEVATDANKKTIAAAVKQMFNVSPLKVAIVRIPKKNKFIRGKIGVTGGGKKAYVYLKKGETIEFV
jgi:large subunit ribosomal protein L23